MKIVGEAEVIDLIEGSPELVWKKTCDGAGIEKSFLIHIIVIKKWPLRIV